ncbi:hypothetical protein HMPREF0762_01753 [Slackia exigua ATCC 700122]|uniref:Uncharacterized protein n=1 Tax=Slackia exigua (strain ATCC 700122 / DSM 15923 / CIP 105133 / JCM 11022 / KCTC 5966 / S-7) TaxID=649764 RepID=D0WIS8_SLAES|nr:hypothetical protein HMPREF0762_01753 [Slackia exigua ATCC 700122]
MSSASNSMVEKGLYPPFFRTELDAVANTMHRGGRYPLFTARDASKADVGDLGLLDV